MKMIHLNVDQLNKLERFIHQELLEKAKEHQDMTINDAAHFCGCSVSKISKFAHKLGFKNYKEYTAFLYGKDIPAKSTSNELERIKHFIDSFDTSLVDDVMKLINKQDKIILFGYGPSLICAQYFEYKLRIVTNKMVVTALDEVSAENLLDERSLLIIFSTTGKFTSFENLINKSKTKKSELLLLIEEYNTSLLQYCDNIIYLTDSFQPETLSPYEKSRVTFFIFIEEIINRYILLNCQTN